MDRVLMVAYGAGLLRAELNFLRNTERPAVARATVEVRPHGDGLHENFKCKVACDQQSSIKGQIKKSEHRLAHGEVIWTRPETAGGRTMSSAAVRMISAKSSAELHYRVANEGEVDIKAGMISAHTLIGKEADGQRRCRCRVESASFEKQRSNMGRIPER